MSHNLIDPIHPNVAKQKQYQVKTKTEMPDFDIKVWGQIFAYFQSCPIQSKVYKNLYTFATWTTTGIVYRIPGHLFIYILLGVGFQVSESSSENWWNEWRWWPVSQNECHPTLPSWYQILICWDLSSPSTWSHVSTSNTCPCPSRQDEVKSGNSPGETHILAHYSSS